MAERVKTDKQATPSSDFHSHHSPASPHLWTRPFEDATEQSLLPTSGSLLQTRGWGDDSQEEALAPNLQAQLEAATCLQQNRANMTIFPRQAATVQPKVQSKMQPKVQPKLTVGEPDDSYEREADEVAEQVMSMAPPATPPVQRQSESGLSEPPAWAANWMVQRQTEEMENGAIPSVHPFFAHLVQREPIPDLPGSTPSPDLENRLANSQGSGSPLPDDVRSFMEPRFGTDFSQVQVHTGSDAVQMNRELGAQAFTHGSHIYYGAGKAPAKDNLTSHELTHVVQQTGAKQAEPVLQRFPISLDTVTRANFNLVYKVFDHRGNLVVTNQFRQDDQSLSIHLDAGRSYVIQIIGNVAVTANEAQGTRRDSTDIRVNWPVRVDGLGNISIRPTALNVSPNDQNTRWVLDATLLDPYTSENQGRLGIVFAYTDSTVTTHTRSETSGTSVSGEGSLEPAGVGGAVTIGGTSETAEGLDVSTSRPISRRFGLYLDLSVPVQEPRGSMVMGAISQQRVHRVFFPIGSDEPLDFSFNGIPIWYTSLNEVTRQRIASGEETLRVIGYADTTGDPRENLDLSGRRAQAVRDILYTYIGDRASITTRGPGEFEAQTPDDTPDSFERRADIFFFETEEL